MIKLKFSLGICLVLFSASADDLLFKAYKSYFNLSNKCEVRKVAYTFKGSMVILMETYAETKIK